MRVLTDMADSGERAAREDAGRTEFEDLLLRHRGIVLKVAGMFCHRLEDRRDLAQEIYTEVWRAYPSFDERRRFSTWMYRIALNVAISHSRRLTARRHVAGVPDMDLDTLPDRGALAPDDRVRDLYRVIARLDDLHRALVLLYLEGYAYQEIADVLGITETNVATRLNRLKARLRSELTEEHRGTR